MKSSKQSYKVWKTSNFQITNLHMSSDASFMKVQNMFNNMMKDKIIKFFETDIQASKLTLVYN